MIYNGRHWKFELISTSEAAVNSIDGDSLPSYLPEVIFNTACTSLESYDRFPILEDST